MKGNGEGERDRVTLRREDIIEIKIERERE